jgi:hypothetical protein
MDRLDAMQLYVAVVDAHSFARAAEVLGQPRSTVSRVVKELEAWLGAQLLQRTTRKLSVTAEDAGITRSVNGCWPRWRRWKPPFPAGPARRAVQGGDAAISCPALRIAKDRRVSAAVS